MIQCVGAATAMHDILAWGVADPGDGVLTSRPVYGRFELDFGNKSQVRVVYSDNKTEEAFQDDIVEKFEEALMRSKKAGIHVKMVLIINPHNPLGKKCPYILYLAVNDSQGDAILDRPSSRLCSFARSIDYTS
jgi:bifunctional pyridoxal-dependent enzyme with beta-cystathionase and maltose regulon repressor activities